jgi:hypothetical protein
VRGRAKNDIAPGQRYGRWTVLERGPTICREVKWECRCDCETVQLVGSGNLRGNRSQSCGCLQADTNRGRAFVGEIQNDNTTHSAEFGDARFPDAFWSRCAHDPLTGCWLWTATISRDGYGSLKWKINGRSTHGAYRVAYVALVGIVPDGLHLDHLCRVRRCVNPAHLEPVTPRENILRGTAPSARNARKVACSSCGGALSFMSQEPQSWRRCQACRRRTANALEAKRGELGLCHQAASHGPATRGRRCDACASEHARREAERRNQKKVSLG